MPYHSTLCESRAFYSILYLYLQVLHKYTDIIMIKYGVCTHVYIVCVCPHTCDCV